MRAQRLTLSAAQVQAKSAAIGERLLALPVFATARKVFTYVSRGNEVGTHGLIQQLLATGREVGVPAFDMASDLYFASLVREFPGDLVAGKLDILEPKPAMARPVPLSYFGVLVIPGLAFDRRGCRLGRGKGYFDRMLEAAQGVKIALAYDFEVLSEVPVADHDVHMDFVVTETQIVQCRRTDQ